MANDSQVNDAQDRYLRIWNRAEKVPDLPFAVCDARWLATWSTAR
jgi:hypothetical protein